MRILAAFFVLLVMTRLMGKKQLSQLTFFHYITGITIGSVAASLTTDNRLPIFQGIYSLVLWGCLTILLGIISLKVASVRVSKKQGHKRIEDIYYAEVSSDGGLYILPEMKDQE